MSNVEKDENNSFIVNLSSCVDVLVDLFPGGKKEEHENMAIDRLSFNTQFLVVVKEISEHHYSYLVHGLYIYVWTSVIYCILTLEIL